MKIPQQVEIILDKLKKQGFEAYIVGGCVRDYLLARQSVSKGGRRVEPKDWDITTNAMPEEIQEIFLHPPQFAKRFGRAGVFYDNKFGTVRINLKTQISKLKTTTKKSKLKEADIIEITTYRTEETYSDKRHPDRVRFGVSLKEDLARRDFTINAMAMEPPLNLPLAKGEKKEGVIIDPFQGQKDLEQKIVRAVGQPEKRFSEDALRLMRAVRLATELNFAIEEKTLKAIKKNASWLQAISKERIRDELIKIIKSDRPTQGILLLKDAELLAYIIPELEKGIGISQNKHHIYTIYQHSILSLKHCPSKKLSVRLASLFHDIAKPETKRGEGPEATFYAHDQVGAKSAIRILRRLKFPKKIIEKVAILIRNHMFLTDPEKVTEAGARRLLRRVGPENIGDLIDLRIADRLGSGCPKARPYRLRHFEYLLSKVSRDPISTKMLKIDGNDVMKILKIEPGPRVGLILEALLSEVLEEPKKNTKKYLSQRIKELNELSEKELKGKIKIVEEKKEEIELAEKRRFYL